MEMEIIHRQEELEHAELERALLLSLAMEEERLEAMLLADQAKAQPAAAETSALPSNPAPADAKHSVQVEEETYSHKSHAKSTVSESKSSATKKKITQATTPSVDPQAFADIKPLKLRGNFAPLPSIMPKEDAMRAAEELAEKKQAVEDAMRKANQQLAGQRRNEEEFRQQVAGVDPEEAERRARYLKEQRDLLLAKKKAEREAKVKAEEERKRREPSEQPPLPTPDAKSTGKSGFIASLDSKGAPSEEELAEMRRATMRMALARRMKLDLMESEDAKMAELQESQFAEYDRKLQQVEQMREDNRKREYVLNKLLSKQQEQMARNLKLSAASLAEEN
jgi:hypothetical protein